MRFLHLKEQEYNTQSIEWHANRELAKINYKLQTDAIQQNLLLEIDKSAHANIYATEADMLNMIIFGKTAKEHKQTGEKGNLRDTATPLQNAIVANLEFLNAMLITQGIEQSERYNMLKAQAEHMKTTLQNNPTIKKLT